MKVGGFTFCSVFSSFEFFFIEKPLLIQFMFSKINLWWIGMENNEGEEVCKICVDITILVVYALNDTPSKYVK